MNKVEPASSITTAVDTSVKPENAPALVKKIWKTTYVVRLYFNKIRKETMSDKTKRMFKTM